ncbi:MAG TPA: hypothetical protein VMT52_15480 [Planctomycetota bacterium]|nr:hypothetical protein [Planctomycetota bacterium]
MHHSMIRSTCLSLLILSPAALAAVEVDPPNPTVCDTVVLVVTRTFSQDCGWSASAVTDVRPGGEIDVTLTPVRASEICLQVIREVTFRIPIGTFPAGNYSVAVRWSDLAEVLDELATFEVTEAECPGFQRGDTNADGLQNLTDAVAILGHLFLGGSVSCLDASDTDSSERVELTDAIFLLSYLFLGGPPPGAPFPGCGGLPDGVASLGCDRTACGAGNGEQVWMEKPDGCVQCEPCTQSLEGAVGALEDAGIEVFASGTANVPVCLACQVCASGRLFRVLVASGDVPALEAMGWSVATEG